MCYEPTPICRPIDEYAILIPKNSGLLPCLYVPIAARDTAAIEKYVGRIAGQLPSSALDKALLVEAYEPEKPDPRLAIWDLPEAAVLHFPRQVWVHVDYRAYRRAYQGAFPSVNLTGLVLDHVLNRASGAAQRLSVSANRADLARCEFQPRLSE
jgi:hypothetical protein